MIPLLPHNLGAVRSDNVRGQSPASPTLCSDPFALPFRHRFTVVVEKGLPSRA